MWIESVEVKEEDSVGHVGCGLTLGMRHKIVLANQRR